MIEFSFKVWFEGATSGKTGLYPLSYGGIGLYPPQTYLPPSADGLYYLTQDERIYKGNEGPPHDITHIPGKPSAKGPTAGEGKPWTIKHLKSDKKPKVGNFSANLGDGGLW